MCAISLTYPHTMPTNVTLPSYPTCTSLIASDKIPPKQIHLPNPRPLEPLNLPHRPQAQSQTPLTHTSLCVQALPNSTAILRHADEPQVTIRRNSAVVKVAANSTPLKTDARAATLSTANTCAVCWTAAVLFKACGVTGWASADPICACVAEGTTVVADAAVSHIGAEI